MYQMSLVNSLYTVLYSLSALQQCLALLNKTMSLDKTLLKDYVLVLHLLYMSKCASIYLTNLQ